MARPPTASQKTRAEQPHWDGTEWNSEPDEAACLRARRLLGSGGGTRLRDRVAWTGALRSTGAKWAAGVIGGLVLIFALCFAALWWRLGAGPINLDMATPWLAEAIEQNIGQGNTVEIGGTQIERAGRIRIAVRIRDVIVRDRDHAIVATAPKAEVRLSGSALLTGQLRAESLNLVDAELAIRITADGNVTVSTGNNEKPLATGVASPRAAFPSAPGGERSNSSQSNPVLPPAADANPLLAGLDWLDSLSLTGLDGQNLNEIGLKNGTLIVDDQQRGTRFSFENVSLSLRRPSSGGITLSLGEESETPWSLRVAVGAPADGVRAVEIRANKVSTANILLAMRLKDLTYGADLPLTGELKGEIGRDGVPTVFRGRLTAGAGTITDSDTPDYPLHIDQAEFNVEWDSARRVLLMPFKVVAGSNRVTLLAHFGMASDTSAGWELGFSGGTIVLPGDGSEQPLIFNKIAVRFRIDPRNQRVSLSELNINNGEVGFNGSGTVDYSGEPTVNMTFVGTPMSASALKRMWPILIVPEVREWVLERVERGTLQRIDIGIRSPVRNLSRKGPPIPDDGLLVNIVANNVTMRPVDDLPLLRDGELRARVTGRTATVAINQASMETAGGRKLAINDIVFEVPDMAPKPAPARVRLKIDGPVPALAEILSSDRLAEFTGAMIDPATSKGNVSAQVTLGLPIKRELTKADTTYAITADLSGFSADKLAMGQKIEAGTLKVIANNQGYQVRGDIKINGQQAALEYRKPADGDADVKVQATLDDASRARLGIDLGAAVTGAVPVRLVGKIATGDRETKFGMECDLTALKLDNLLPGWIKLAGRPARATFTMIQKPQSTRFEDIVVEGGGASIKGAVELDPNGDLMSASFPVYSPNEGDKTSMKAERGLDGALRITMRGDVFDGRGFIKSAVSGREADAKSKLKNLDFDLDLKLGAVAGFYGEAVRGVDIKLARRGGTIRSLALSGKIGRDTTQVTGDIRGRAQGRDVMYVETGDAGAFFRFTDTYGKMFGGQLALAMDLPTADSTRAKEGLINVRDFQIRGEPKLAAAGGGGPQSSVLFSRLRAEFTRQNGQLTIREGVVKGPAIGATIEGSIDYLGNQVRMSGTFVPLYGLNNMFGQIPLFGQILGGGSNEGLFAFTYEVVGTPSAPDVRTNPASGLFPGITRKLMEFNTGKQNNAPEFPTPYN